MAGSAVPPQVTTWTKPISPDLNKSGHHDLERARKDLIAMGAPLPEAEKLLGIETWTRPATVAVSQLAALASKELGRVPQTRAASH